MLDMAQVDGSGRFSARALLRAFGWTPGQRFDLAVIGDAVVIGPSATGRHTIGARGEIAVPSSARVLLGLKADHRIVLAAAPQQNVLVAHPHATVARLLAEHYGRQLLAGDGDDG